MRKLLMVVLAAALLAAPILAAGQFGSVEMGVWLALVILWFVALFRWAIPKDRQVPANPRSGDPRRRV